MTATQETDPASAPEPASTLAAEPASGSGTAVRPPRTKPWEDYVFLLLNLWTIVGLGLDGFFHLNSPELESFWTPWHGVLYSGFTASVSFLAWRVIVRRAGTSSLRTAIPQGYELATIGLMFFALAGVGDAIWHEIFGVESTIDALLSPTHLVLFVGGMLGSTAPARAAWRDLTGRKVTGGLRTLLPTVLSIGFTATVAAFFFQYASGFDNWPMTAEFTPEQTAIPGYGVLKTMTSTVILMGAALVLARRWDPPFGTFTVMFGMVGVFLAGLEGYERPWQVVSAFAGGLAADFVVRAWPHRWVLFGAIVPTVMWSTHTALMAVFHEVQWPPELWAGQIVMAAIVGVGLSLLAFPPAPGLDPDPRSS